VNDLKSKRAVVLLSGGLDSVVSLACALDVMDVRLAIFFNYGQRALQSERNAVMGVVNYYSVPFKEIALEWLKPLCPEGMREDAPQTEELAPASSLSDSTSVWIPNRNGVFLNVASAFAENYRCDYVVTGFNREEATEFPDNRAEYVSRLNRALMLSTRNHVKIMSFIQDLSKREIIELGNRLRVPLTTVWSCYQSGRLMCGVCASCRKLKSAIAALPGESRPSIEFLE
jgi:7-cyano-7-deazaguanine synthase